MPFTFMLASWQWYGQVMRKQDEDWVKKCVSMKVAGKKPKDRPKLACMDAANRDMDRMDLTPVVKVGLERWRNSV
jgi:hypothetical protein